MIHYHMLVALLYDNIHTKFYKQQHQQQQHRQQQQQHYKQHAAFAKKHHKTRCQLHNNHD